MANKLNIYPAVGYPSIRYGDNWHHFDLTTDFVFEQTPATHLSVTNQTITYKHSTKIKFTSFLTDKDEIDTLLNFQNMPLTFYFVGLDFYYEVNNLFLYFEIERNYPESHKIIVYLTGDLPGIITPGINLLGNWGGFENNDGNIGDGWENVGGGSIGIISPSFIPDGSGGQAAQTIQFNASTGDGFRSEAIYLPLRNGMTITISAWVKKILPEIERKLSLGIATWRGEPPEQIANVNRWFTLNQDNTPIFLNWTTKISNFYIDNKPVVGEMIKFLIRDPEVDGRDYIIHIDNIQLKLGGLGDYRED